jgi:uncharacterized protein (DUF362 family)
MQTRRGIIGLLFVAVVALFFWRSALLRHLLSRARQRFGPRIPGGDVGETAKSLVGIAGGEDVEGTIRQAVALIGGFKQFDLKGKTVMVKPNVVANKPPPSTTSPEVVGAMVRILYAEGAKQVYCGDMSAAMHLDTIANMVGTGIKKAAEQAGAQVIAFEHHHWVEVAVPQAAFKRVLVTEWLYKVDFWLNLPVIKTHRSASYSICLKNFVGCTHVRQRPYLIDANRWEEVVAELNLAYRPDLNIVDGTVSMIAGGPWEGTPARTSLIIASTDRVAADVAGLGVIKAFGTWEKVAEKGAWEQKQITRALELGIGKGKEEIVLLDAGKGSEFKELMKRARAAAGLPAY